MRADASLLAVPDPVTPIPSGRLMPRFAHLAPGAPALDMVLADGTTLFTSVGYRSVTAYAPVGPATHTLRLRAVGSNNVVLTAPNAALTPGRFYTVYAVGQTGSSATPLQVLIPLMAIPISIWMWRISPL